MEVIQQHLNLKTVNSKPRWWLVPKGFTNHSSNRHMNPSIDVLMPNMKCLSISKWKHSICSKILGDKALTVCKWCFHLMQWKSLMARFRVDEILAWSEAGLAVRLVWQHCRMVIRNHSIGTWCVCFIWCYGLTPQEQSRDRIKALIR